MLTDTQKKLVEDNIRLIQWIAARWRNPKLEPDDIFQIAAVGFCKAARDYDSSKGKFSVFALQYATNELLSASGRRKNVKVYSLDLPIKCGDGNLTIGMALRADSNLDADIVAGQVMELVRAASTAERRILTLMSCGYRQHEAAKLLRMSRQNVQQTIKRVKPKFDQVTGIFLKVHIQKEVSQMLNFFGLLVLFIIGVLCGMWYMLRIVKRVGLLGLFNQKLHEYNVNKAAGR